MTEKNPFHLVKDLIKHPAHPNLILSSRCYPCPHLFSSYISVTKQNLLQRKPFVVVFLFFFLFPSSSQSQITERTVSWKLYFLGSRPTSSFILYLIPLIHFFTLPLLFFFPLCFQTKSFEIASTKLGADMRMEMVHMMLKTLKATRHRRSITAPANFHWSLTLSASSCSRKRSAMYRTSSRIACSWGSPIPAVEHPPSPPVPTPKPPPLETVLGQPVSMLGVGGGGELQN